MKLILKKYFWKEQTFWSDGCFDAAQVREQVMIQSKSILEIKVNSDSSNRLKTNGTNRLKNIKESILWTNFLTLS